MKGGSRPLGYTIIEVMIVLAISGVMFVMAATFISGKQAKTSFTVGTNDLSSQVQTVISQVINGSYSDVNITCHSNGGVTTISLGGSGQGTNQDCVFIGKVIYFGYTGSFGSDYQVLSLAGARLSAGAPNKTFKPSDVAPAVIDPLTSDKTVSQNLNVSSVTEDDASGTQTSSAIAFIQSLGATDSTGQFSSGSQSVGLYYVKNVTPGSNIVNAVAGGANLLPAKDAKICINDGSGQRYAQLQIGLNDTDQLTTTLTGVSIC